MDSTRVYSIDLTTVRDERYLKMVAGGGYVINFEKIADDLMPSMAALVAFAAAPAAVVAGLFAVERAAKKVQLGRARKKLEKWLAQYKKVNKLTVFAAKVVKPLAALSFLDILMSWGDLIASARTLRSKNTMKDFNSLDVWYMSNAIVPFVAKDGWIASINDMPQDQYDYVDPTTGIPAKSTRYKRVMITFDQLLIAVLATEAKYASKPIGGTGATALRELFMWMIVNDQSYGFLWVKEPYADQTSSAVNKVKMLISDHQFAPLVMAAYIVSITVPLPQVKLMFRSFLIKQGRDLSLSPEFRHYMTAVAYGDEEVKYA